MKQAEKNEKQESDNALFTNREKSLYWGRFQAHGGAGSSGLGQGGTDFRIQTPMLSLAVMIVIIIIV